ncbi:uncharacterized protein LOC142490669 [Ascaphus truei]|uniref:uncharacterized protein LOC142490669 n=1 Tax=Ascaphus truei TaxID=8439 RepID=UPI003F5A1E55
MRGILMNLAAKKKREREAMVKELREKLVQLSAIHVAKKQDDVLKEMSDTKIKLNLLLTSQAERELARSKRKFYEKANKPDTLLANKLRNRHPEGRFDDIRSKLKKKIQQQRVHASGTGGGPTPQRLILTPLEELLRAKLLPVVVEGLPGDRDIGIYPSQFPPVAPGGHVSPETEQVSSPGSASSTHLEEHDEEDYDDDDDDDAAAIDTQIQASDHEEVPIETVLPPNRPANTTYDAIVASEGKIVEAENRRHSDLMTVLERMIALQEETVSQLAHLHRVFIEVPKQLQKINTSFEALVVQQTQANYLRMTNVPQFNLNTSQAGSVHAVLNKVILQEIEAGTHEAMWPDITPDLVVTANEVPYRSFMTASYGTLFTLQINSDKLFS